MNVNLNMQLQYIKEKHIEFAMNIDEFEMGQIIFDSKYKDRARIINILSNSIEVFITKKNKTGINSNQYFDMRSFSKRFSKI